MKKRLLTIVTFIFALACFSAFSVGVFAYGETHTVTFAPETDEFMAESVEVEDGEKVCAPDGIKRAGYKVTWLNGSSEYDFSEPVVEDITLNASWSAAYTDAKGNDVTYDKNGATSAKVWYNGSVVARPAGTWLDKNGEYYSYNGITDADTQYFVYEEGSVFTLGARAWVKENADAELQKVLFPGYIQLGEGFDVNNDILIKFRVDPTKAWSIQNGGGKFSISIHFQESDLHGWGPAGHADPYGLVVWGSSDPDDNVFRRLSGQMADAWTDPQIAYDDGEFAYLTIHIGDTTEESYFALNGNIFITGAQIASTPVLDPSTGQQIGGLYKSLCKANFTGEGKTGKAYINLTSHDVPLQFQVKAESVESKVTFVSETAGFTEKKQAVSSARLISLPDIQNIAGYDFIGYYKDEAMIIPFDESERIYEDVTVYAKYLPSSGARNTLTLTGDGYPEYSVTLASGSNIPDLSKVYLKAGFTPKWTKNGVLFDTNTAINGDIALKVKWEETELDLYHYQFGVLDGKKFEYRADENFWTEEYTNYELADIYVDADGNTVIGSLYGGQQHDDSFFTEDDFTRFVLPGMGSMLNLQKLDVSKKIVIKYAAKNWDAGNGNNGFGVSSIVFSLFDNVYEALKCPNPVNSAFDTGAKLRIETSNLNHASYSAEFFHLPDLYGKYTVHETGVTSRSFGYEDETFYTIEIFISEDGNSNYLKINGEIIDGATDGIKRSDFEGGVAYLQLTNYGCTNVFDALVSQQSHLTAAAAAHGTFTSDMPADGILLFKDKVTFTCTPASGYTLRCAKIGDKEYLPDDSTHVSVYKGWNDETVEIVFSKSCTITFNTMGGNNIRSQTVLSGEKFYSPTTPKKKGYKFKGWHLDESCTVKYNFSLPAEEDITVYAKWSDGTEIDDVYEDELQPWGCGVGCDANITGGLSLIVLIPAAIAFLAVKSVLVKRKNGGK